jgi:shikimate kinase
MKKNLVLLGMMGVGKSTLARKLASKYNLKFIDIDSKIELKNSMSIKRIFEIKGESFFRKNEEEITLEYLNKSNCVIALGGGAFINKKIRDSVLSLSTSIWLDVSNKVLEKRLINTSKRPLLKKQTLKKEIEKIYNERKKIYKLANYKINCDKLSLNDAVRKIMDIYESQ